MGIWHTEAEKDLFEIFGGTWEKGYGADGHLADGRPAEARVAKKDTRFRIGRDVHQDLLANDGAYLFDDLNDGLPPRQVSAHAVDELIDGRWYEDRGYDHSFVNVDDIF